MKKLLIVGLLLISQLSFASSEYEFQKLAKNGTKKEYDLVGARKCAAAYFLGGAIVLSGLALTGQSFVESQKHTANENCANMHISGVALVVVGAGVMGFSLGKMPQDSDVNIDSKKLRSKQIDYL